MARSILLHTCCAHCTAYTVEYWRQQGYEITAFWYNPNIHPYTEHQNRLEAIRKLSKEMNFPLIVAEGYEMADYFRAVVGNETERCQYCFRLRLGKTAKATIRGNFIGFTTTLLISPHQKHDLIKEVGNKVAEDTRTQFLYADLRKRYSDSRHITKPMDLYRQQYCGCLYSEWERYKTNES